MNDDQATVSLLSVPDTYRKGGRLTWHQKRCHRTVLKILKTLEESVLDYGCGYGDLTYAISKTHHACGTDLDPHRVAFAKAEYAPLEFKSVHRLLKPRGHLILACKDAHHVRNYLRKVAGRGPLMSHLSTRSRSEVRGLLDQAGFEVQSETYFYDPPFTTWRGIGDAVVGSIEQVLSLAGVAGAAGYFVMLARKNS